MPMPRPHPALSPLFFLLLLGPLGCSTPKPGGDPLGEPLPTVRAETLAGQPLQLPANITGVGENAEPAILLIGYRQDARFDIDRWRRALADASIEAPVYELLAIPGLVPRLFARSIRSELRAGTPPEQRRALLTVFADAEKLTRFTGAANPVPARVLLLSQEGRVAFFHNQGYSVQAQRQLKEASQKLRKDAAE